MSQTKNDFTEAMRIIQRIFRKRRESELALVQNQIKCMRKANNINILTEKGLINETTDTNECDPSVNGVAAAVPAVRQVRRRVPAMVPTGRAAAESWGFQTASWCFTRWEVVKTILLAATIRILPPTIRLTAVRQVRTQAPVLPPAAHHRVREVILPAPGI